MINLMTMFSPLKTCLCLFNMCRAFLVTVIIPVRFSSRVLIKKTKLVKWNQEIFPIPKNFHQYTYPMMIF
jgi:hypothetical protein